VLPANILRATRYLIRWLWQLEMRGQRLAHGSPQPEITETPGGYVVPKLVIEMLGADRRVPGLI
jgi:hypothetical protein